MNENTLASKFLRTLYPKRIDGFIEIRTLARNLPDREPQRGWYNLNNPNQESISLGLDGYCRSKSQAGYDVYYSVCAHSERSGKKATVNYIPALWVDVDMVDDQAKAAIKSFPLKPSLVVSSGRGLHLYWLLTEPMRIDKEAFLNLEILLKILCTRCRGDLNTCDLSRILRLPGTLNQKNRKSVRVIKYNQVRYTMWQLTEALL